MEPDDPGKAVPAESTMSWDADAERRSRPLLDRIAELAKVQYDLIIRSIAGTCGVDSDTAKDLFQDVCERIAKSGINTEPESILGYLCVAARNRHIDLVRKEARAEAKAAASVEPTPQYLLGDGDPTVTEVAVRMLLVHGFDDLDALPRKERNAVVLRHCFNYTQAEIAEELKITPKQVDNLLQQARRRFASNQAAREANPGYAILALILRPARSHATTLACPAGFSSLAASVAFTVFAATATGGVPASNVGSPLPAQTRVATTLPSDWSSAPASSGSVTVRRVVGARLTVREPEPASRPRVTPTTITVPSACTDRVCVGTGPNGIDRPGDTVTVSVAGREMHASESVTPVCEYVPATTATRCDRQEPANWIVKDIPPTPNSGGPS